MKHLLSIREPKIKWQVIHILSVDFLLFICYLGKSIEKRRISMPIDGQDVYVYGKRCRKVGDHCWLSIFVSEDKKLMIINNIDGALYGLMNNSRESIDSLFEIMGYRKDAKEVLSLF